MYNTAPISSHALSLAPMRVDTRSLSTVSCVLLSAAQATGLLSEPLSSFLLWSWALHRSARAFAACIDFRCC